MNRRGFMLGLLAAPVIVRSGVLMPVKAPPLITLNKVLVDSPTRELAQSLVETKEVVVRNTLSSASFRKILEPDLRKIFDEVYNGPKYNTLHLRRI